MDTKPVNVNNDSTSGQYKNEVPAAVSAFLAAGLAGAAVERHIEWVDTDAAGHQHNSVVMRFVEAAEAKLFRDLGLKSYFPTAPRVRHEIDYRAKLFFGQLVTTVVRVDRLGTTSMSFAFEVWGHPHEARRATLAAEGKFVTVCVPIGEQASAPWPQEIVEALQG